MKNLTADQHLKWYVDDELFGTRSNDYQKFRLELGRISRPLKPWADELNEAMTKLIDEHGSQLAVFYSGGSDSEVVLRTLVGLGVKPEVFTIEFKGEENLHETKHSETLCSLLGLRRHVFTHDTARYVKHQLYRELANQFQCSQIAYLTVLEYVTKVDLPAIMGGEVYLQKHQQPSDTVESPSSWYYIYREDEDGLTYRYSKKTGHTLINEVLTYTPELLASWLVHPIIKSVANNEVPGKITLLSVKRSVYEEQLGYPLLAQTKFHGYESLAWTNLNVATQLKQGFHSSGEARVEYTQLLRDLTQ